MEGWLIGLFTCPRCGSHTWSAIATTQSGACQGHVPNPDGTSSACTFTWSRVHEDHLYIDPDPLAKVFTSQE